MCSKKCAPPYKPFFSNNDPVLNHNPTDTLSTCGIGQNANDDLPTCNDS
jgi:hypothetical protein